jgi:hypothetical protein
MALYVVYGLFNIFYAPSRLFEDDSRFRTVPGNDKNKYLDLVFSEKHILPVANPWTTLGYKWIIISLDT